jgi:hypothetical protein
MPDSPTSMVHLQYALETTTVSYSSTVALMNIMTPCSISTGNWLESQGQWDLALQYYLLAP